MNSKRVFHLFDLKQFIWKIKTKHHDNNNDIFLLSISIL